MIRNIVFDMGEVLIHFDRDYFINRLGFSGEDAKKLMLEVFRSLEWAMMDRGTINEEEAGDRICARVPAHLHDAVRKLVGMWDRPILPVEGIYELIAELKGLGYPIYLLSNASLRQHDYWPRIPASRFFDGTLVSADHLLVKPQPEIYRLLYKTFDLTPEECFFIDDSPQNIEGAHFTGMPGFVFNHDVKPLRRRLRELGVPVRTME